MKDTVERGQVVDVQTGAVKACKGKGGLQASAIGSCVAVAAYDPRARVGVLAHVNPPSLLWAPVKGGKVRYTVRLSQSKKFKA